MPRVFNAYVPAVRSGGAPHATATSTGTADIKTITPPPEAVACYISVTTQPARMTFDGTSPGAGVGPGIIFPTGVAPVYMPLGTTIKFAANAAGNSIVDVLWLE